MGKAFAPTHIIFAPTSQCNLFCKHCFVNRTIGISKNKITIVDAKDFLKSCKNTPIEHIGFSGGEPFLELEFLSEIIKEAVDQDFYFDRLMTNAVWWNSEVQCTQALEKIASAGFDGTLGISFDTWHGQNPSKIARFIQIAYDVFKTNNLCEITTVSNSANCFDIDLLNKLASELGGNLITKEKKPLEMQVPSKIATFYHIPISLIELSKQENDATGWNSKKWFKDDFCEGPGHVLYIHADGRVAVCCGFANEQDSLIIGSIQDGYKKLMRNAQTNAYVSICYETGLHTYRKELQKQGITFPGKTKDICFFCAHLCKNNLT